MSILTSNVPRKLKPLLYPKRYKGAYGGRGGGKSHFFAEEIILRCYERETRVACIREVQKSIKNSVHRLLADKIEKFGLQAEFEVLETEIRGRNGSVIIFQGMQNHTADSIKSLEAYDLVWVEEAQTLSEFSFNILRPTLRQKGSELWFSWNPRYKTDPVDKFFRKNPPDNAVSVMINWRDNPWFKTDTELYDDMIADYERDPDTAEHVWGGAYGAGKGAILARWVNKAEREGRITNDVEFDPDGADVEISSDIGFRDTAGWWFWQRKVGGFSVLGYTGASGMDAEEWIPELEKVATGWGIPPARIGKIYLPADAKAKTFQSKYSSIERFIKHFGARRMAEPIGSKKADQIAAARFIIDKCEFNKERCEDGLDGLMAWEFEWNEDTNVFSREPLHNWASHPGDAFAYGAQRMKEIAPVTERQKPRHLEIGTSNPSQITIEDAWSTQGQAASRF